MAFFSGVLQQRRNQSSLTSRFKRACRTGLILTGCLLGASIAMALALYVSTPPASPLLLASLGGSAVFLFGLTKMPAAQPRALFGGHLGGALIGIICYQCFGDALWVYVLAEVATMLCLLLTRSVHPPAGANPLIMLHSHAALPVLWQTVLPGVLSLALVAWIWSRTMPGVARYPHAWLAPSPATILDAVLADDQPAAPTSARQSD